MKPTLALSLIVPTLNKALLTKLKAWEPYFDAFYIQENGRKSKHKSGDKLHISYRKWDNDFAAARNALLSEVETEYWAWVDDDDEVDWAQVNQLLAQMEDENLDVIYLPYNYAVNTLNEPIAWHYRERIIRTEKKFTWKGVAHETLIPDDGFAATAKSDLIVINHIKSQADFEKSKERNIEIFKREWKKNKDPRIAMNLADAYFGVLNFQEAAPLYLEHIKTSGSKEDIYHSWLMISRMHWMEGESQKAIAAAHEALGVLPGYPDAYFRLGQYLNEQGDHGAAIEWFKNGFAKPIPESLRIVDQTELTYRPLMAMALSYAQLGEFAKARKLLAQVEQMSPDFPLLKSGVRELIDEGFYQQEAIERLKWLFSYYKDYKGDVKSLFKSLPASLQQDLRLGKERREVFPPIKWPEKSIVFFCGPSHETWGPETLDKGMGGSEEAVLYLSRELAKLGWQVTVYNEREEQYLDRGIYTYDGNLNLEGVDIAQEHIIRYLPWTEFNVEDTFDVFVAWRNPSLLGAVKARLKCLDMHDFITGHQYISPEAVKHIDKVFFKSKFQRQAAPQVPDEKAVIVPNGIVLEQFDHQVGRLPHKVMYASSADRGLDNLLDLWPEVLKEVPTATLSWAYGWNAYDNFHKNNPEQMKWKWEIIRKMHEVGCQALGRLSHEDLAKEMLSTSVWAYPTRFPEIDCITAKKFGIAGAIPITSGWAALQESILEPQPNYKEQFTAEQRQEFIERLVGALKEGRSEEERKKMAKKYEKFAWSEIARGWHEVCVAA